MQAEPRNQQQQQPHQQAHPSQRGTASTQQQTCDNTQQGATSGAHAPNSALPQQQIAPTSEIGASIMSEEHNQGVTRISCKFRQKIES